jgi:hypothetical protein
MAMKRYILHENTIDTVLDLDRKILPSSNLHISNSVTEILANEMDNYDITDKTTEFKK